MTTKLVDVSDDYKELCKIANYMRGDKYISEVFKDRIDRLASSRFSFMIRRNNKDIGFVNLVIEKGNHDFYFVDIGLKEEYRNKGVGTEILKKLQEMDFDRFVLLEVKNDNEAANISINKVGVKVTTIGNINYYLLQKDRVQEFIDGDYLEKLSNHVSIKSKKDLIFKK